MSDLFASETKAARRERMIDEGRLRLLNRIDQRWGSLNLSPAAAAAWDGAIETAYVAGMEVMADIAQPLMGSADLAAMEAREESARDTAALARLRALPAPTIALAINGVIRHLLMIRAQWALKGHFPMGQFHMPSEEARAMAATVEAALGLDLDKLDQTDLFDLRD